MNIGSIKEDLNLEKRISIVPETVKKLVDLNFSVFLEKGYGDHLAINDEEYKNKGTNLKNSAKEVLEKSDIVLSINCPSSNIIHSIKDESIRNQIYFKFCWIFSCRKTNTIGSNSD